MKHPYIAPKRATQAQAKDVDPTQHASSHLSPPREQAACRTPQRNTSMAKFADLTKTDVHKVPLAVSGPANGAKLRGNCATTPTYPALKVSVAGVIDV